MKSSQPVPDPVAEPAAAEERQQPAEIRLDGERGGQRQHGQPRGVDELHGMPAAPVTLAEAASTKPIVRKSSSQRNVEAESGSNTQSTKARTTATLVTPASSVAIDELRAIAKKDASPTSSDPTQTIVPEPGPPLVRAEQLGEAEQREERQREARRR